MLIAPAILLCYDKWESLEGSAFVAWEIFLHLTVVFDGTCFAKKVIRRKKKIFDVTQTTI